MCLLCYPEFMLEDGICVALAADAEPSPYCEIGLYFDTAT